MAVTESTTVEIKIKVNDGTRAPMKAAEKNATELAKTLSALGSGGQAAFSRLQASIIAINQSLDLFGRIARMGSAAFRSVFGTAIDLEKGVAGISTLFDSTAQATRALTADIIALQRRFGSDQADLVSGYYEAIASGAVDAASATSFMVDAQKLAIGGLTSMRVAVDGLTTIIGSYGLAASDAGRINDALFIGAAAGKTNIEQLASSLGQATAFAKASGVSFQELIASVSALTSGGVQTSEAVTQVRSAMVGLVNQTDQLQAILQKLNITSMQAEIRQNGLVSTLRKILAETDGTTESLTTLFGRVEAVNAVLALTNNTVGKKYVDIMDEMGKASENVGVVTEKAFGKMASTTAFRLDQIRARIRTFFAGDQFARMIAPAIEAFSSLIDVVERLGTAVLKIDFAKLGNDISTLAVAVASVGLGFKAWTTYLSAGTMMTAIKYLGELGVLMAKDALIYTVAAGKWLLIAAAITATVAAIDIFIRNIKDIPSLFELVAKASENMMLRIEKALRATFIGVAKLSLGLSELLNKVGIVSKERIDDQKASLEDLMDQYAELSDAINESNSEVSDASKGIDFGFFGDIFKGALKFVDDYNKGISETSKILGDIQKKGALPGAAEAQAPVRRKVEIPPLIAPEQIKLVTGMFGEKAGQFVGAMNGVASKVVNGMGGVVNLLLDFFSAIVNFLPNLVNKAADLVASITDLPMTLLNANRKLWANTERFLREFPTLLSDALLSSLDEVEGLYQRFIDAFMKGLQKIDVILQKFIVFWIRSMTTHIPRLLNESLRILVKEGPKIASAIIEGFKKAIPEAIKAIGDDLKLLANQIAGIFGMKALFKIDDKKLEQDLSKLGDRIMKSASDVFSIVDLEAAGRGMDVADRIRNAIKGAVNEAKDVFTKLWNDLEDAWRRIWEDIAKPFTEAWEKIVAAWRELWDGTLKTLTDAWNKIVELWRELWDGACLFVTTMWNAIVDIWRLLWDGSISATTKSWDIIVAAWRLLWDGSILATTKTWDLIVAAWRTVWDVSVSASTLTWLMIVELWRSLWDGTIKILTDAWRGIVDGLSNFKFPEFPRFSWPEIPKPSWLASTGGFFLPSTGSIMNKAADSFQRSDAGKILGKIGFATGGMATPQGKWLNGKLYAETGAIAQGTDVIDAKLTPGEFVVNREAARSNLGLLSFMNQVKAPIAPVGSNQNFSIVINTKTDLSPEQIRREVIPTLEKELKRKSQDGKFIIATSGIRTNK